MNIFIIVMIYHIITYIMGIFIGFLKTGYSLSFTGILSNIVPVLLMIVVSEILRYAVNKKIEKSKWLLLFSTITFVLIDIMFKVGLFNLDSGKDIVGIISLIVIPSISKNILLNYTSIYFGFYVGIFYRVLMELPEYILPIFPNFNEYIEAILLLVIPIVILFILRKTHNKKTNEENVLKKRWVDKIITISLIVIMIIIVILTSGSFNYFVISIGSGSMSPALNVGDVAVVKKIDDISVINEDDILVFKNSDVVVVHRVTEVIEDNDKISFKTKGDNNENIDEWIVHKENVIGVTDLKISYIGYPTIWLNKQIEN